MLLFLLGPALYAAQVHFRYLRMPWYLPILASVGVLLMVLSVRQRRGVLRSAGLVLFFLLCVLEWLFVLVFARAPAYSGPVQIDHKFPAFATTLANGKAFAGQDLEQGTPTVLVFFRGRW